MILFTSVLFLVDMHCWRIYKEYILQIFYLRERLEAVTTVVTWQEPSDKYEELNQEFICHYFL